MSCIKSFSFSSDGNNVYTPVSVKSLPGGTWVADISISSIFDIAGFKNIDIHGLSVIGSVTTNVSAATGNAICEDWSTPVFLNGQLPLISGNIRNSPNEWNLDNSSAFAKIFNVGKYINEVKFESPIKSVQFIQLQGLRAYGKSASLSNVIDIKWNLQWVFYYTYEGEDK